MNRAASRERGANSSRRKDRRARFADPPSVFRLRNRAEGKKSVGWTRRVPDGCVDRVRPAGGSRRLRGGRQRNERVHDRVRSGHVDDGVAEHVGPADTRLLINAFATRDGSRSITFTFAVFPLDFAFARVARQPAVEMRFRSLVSFHGIDNI